MKVYFRLTETLISPNCLNTYAQTKSKQWRMGGFPQKGQPLTFSRGMRLISVAPFGTRAPFPISGWKSGHREERKQMRS